MHSKINSGHGSVFRKRLSTFESASTHRYFFESSSRPCTCFQSSANFVRIIDVSTIVFAQSTGIILNRLHAHEVFLYQLTFLRKSIVKEEGREKGKEDG